jgi:hypothetical protein
LGLLPGTIYTWGVRGVERPPIGVPRIVPSSPVDAGEDLRCYVTLSRRHETDVRQRQILARIDNGEPATLMFGEAVTAEVEPGAHMLRANNTLFWKRQRFSIEPGEHLEFILINCSSRLTLGLLALLGVAPLFLKIQRRSIA